MCFTREVTGARERGGVDAKGPEGGSGRVGNLCIVKQVSELGHPEAFSVSVFFTNF